MAHSQTGEAALPAESTLYAAGPQAARPERPHWPDAQPRGADARASTRPSPIRLDRWHRRLVVATALGLAATGVIWMGARLALDLYPDLDGSSARAHLHSVLVLHGVLGYAGLVLLGSLLGQHVPSGLRSGRRRATGLSALALSAVLVITALLLYYAGSEAVRDASSAVHQALGIIAVAAVWIHVVRREKPQLRSRVSDER